MDYAVGFDMAQGFILQQTPTQSQSKAQLQTAGYETYEGINGHGALPAESRRE